jgi:hypothetical protein
VAEGNIPPGQYPLLPWRNRPDHDVHKWQGLLPEVHVTIGRDARSSGLSITAWEPTLGEFAQHRTLYAVRWQAPVESVQEALEVVYRGVAAALAALFEVDVTE